jgi:hypothetical protein
MQAISAKYHADRVSESLLLYYWADTDANRAYHLNTIRDSFEALQKAIQERETE